MKASEISAILVRLFALLLFLLSFQQAFLLSNVFSEGTINGMDASPYFIAILTGAPLILGLALWCFPSLVSRFIIKPEIETELTPIHLETLVIVLVVGLGLYILSYSSSDLIYNLTFLHLESRQQALGVGDAHAKANLIATGFEVILGLFLVSRARFVSTKILGIVR